MAVTVSGTSITFNDATVQTTAAVSASTAYDGVGSYVMAFYAANNPSGSSPTGSYLANGTTIAGSSLRVSSRATVNNTALATNEAFSQSTNLFGSIEQTGGGNAFPTNNSTTLSGTWRCMSGGVWATGLAGCCGVRYFWLPMLWVRIS